MNNNQLNKAIADIELALTAGKPSNDVEIHKEQIRFWLDTSYSSILADMIDKDNEIPSGSVIRENCLIQKQDKETCVCESYFTDKYLETSNGILQAKIGTIISLNRKNGEIINPYKNAQERALHSRLAFQMDCKGPNYILSGNRIYLFNGVFPEYETFNISYAPSEITDQTSVSNKVWGSVIKDAINRGKDQLYGTKTDNTNDGKQ